jgi:hypothetical protein
LTTSLETAKAWVSSLRFSSRRSWTRREKEKALTVLAARGGKVPQNPKDGLSG